jgi:hypothetical protein|nr:MAG TPA: PRTRC system protein A [Caudoviricetes sp.]
MSDLNELDLLGMIGVETPKVVTSKDEAKDGDYIIAEDGMYRLVKAAIGDFWVKSESFKNKLIGSPSVQESFEQGGDIPKIPGELFYGIIRFYRDIYKVNKNEVMAQIWWDKEQQKYLVEVPEQTVSGASISYQRTGGWYDDPNKVLVLTSHSHHTMGAFYSSTDNSDEKGKHGIYSFVFGNLVNNADGSFSFKTVQRACCLDALIPLNLEDIFDLYEGCEFLYDVPQEERSKVKERVYAAPYSYPAGKSYPKTGGWNIPESKSAKNVKKYPTPYSWDYDYYQDYNYSDTGVLANAYDNSSYCNIGGFHKDQIAKIFGNEPHEIRKYGSSLYSMVSTLSGRDSNLLYSDAELTEIETNFEVLIQSLSVPEAHPNFVFFLMLEEFLKSMKEALGNVCEVKNTSIRQNLIECSKTFVGLLSASIIDADTNVSIFSGSDTGISLDEMAGQAGINDFYLTERIAGVLSYEE